MQDLRSFRKPLDLVMQADLQGPTASQGVHSVNNSSSDLATKHLPSKHRLSLPQEVPGDQGLSFHQLLFFSPLLP